MADNFEEVENVVVFYPNWLNTCFVYESTGNAEKGGLMMLAIANFICFGKEPDFIEADLYATWKAIKPGLEEQRNKVNKSTSARKNGKRGGRPRKTATAPEPDTATQPPETATPPPPEPPIYQPTVLEQLEEITRPTMEELTEFARKEGLTHVNLVLFKNHYDARDWKDNNGNPIKWRPKLRYWNEKDKQTATPPPRQTAPKRLEEPGYGLVDDEGETSTKSNRHRQSHTPKQISDYGKWYFNDLLKPDFYRFGETYGIKETDLDKFLEFLKSCYIEYSPAMDEKVIYDQYGNVVEDWQPLCLEYTQNLGR